MVKAMISQGDYRTTKVSGLEDVPNKSMFKFPDNRLERSRWCGGRYAWA
jgi:hypothetical protein